MRRRHTGEAGRGPRRRKWQELRQQPRRGIFLLPSLLTTGNLFCGLLALVLASQSRFTEAAVSIFVAMVMDMLDGKVARLTKTTTQFGVEFDSLADVVSFGVAPGFMLYSFALAPLGRAAWLGAAIAAGTYLVAILMVTTFRYYSFKEIDFARRRPAGVLVLVVLGVLIVATHPQWFLFLLFSVYVLSGPTRPLWARRWDAVAAAEHGEAHDRERRV
jgi:CDP-diacylglycerol--serine O-phosphatidyltransferase